MLRLVRKPDRAEPLRLGCPDCAEKVFRVILMKREETPDDPTFSARYTCRICGFSERVNHGQAE